MVSLLVCVSMWGDFWGEKMKDKKRDEEERRDKERYLKFISKHSLTRLVVSFIPPILQVIKLKLRDHLSNLGPVAETSTRLDPIFPCPLQLGVTV